MNEETSTVTEKKIDWKKEIWEWFYTIAIALLIVLVIKGFLFDIVVVDGPSMFPTLVDGDRLIVTKLNYQPKQQDIIILDSAYKNRTEYYKDENIDSKFEQFTNYFKLPKNLKRKYYVKRIIGMPGQTVDIIDAKVYVDGEPLDEAEYYNDLTTAYDPTMQFPFTVSDDCVFVMGDNRPQSKDSRDSELGEVPIEAIAGKCVYRLWPIKAIGGVK